MAEQITFEPDVASLAIADRYCREQGVTLPEVATEAFGAYMASIRQAQALDLDEDTPGS